MLSTMSKTPGTELVDPRIEREQSWALEAFHNRLTWGQMRALAIRPPDAGGLGYAVSLSGIRALVAAARTANGDLSVTREERIERQGIEIDARARAARYDLEGAHAALMSPKPERDEYGDGDEYRAELALYWKKIENASRTVESADRRLAAAMKDERDLHGLNAPTRIEADVTTRDGALDDLNAALAALGADPVEAIA